MGPTDICAIFDLNLYSAYRVQVETRGSTMPFTPTPARNRSANMVHQVTGLFHFPILTRPLEA